MRCSPLSGKNRTKIRKTILPSNSQPNRHSCKNAPFRGVFFYGRTNCAPCAHGGLSWDWTSALPTPKTGRKACAYAASIQNLLSGYGPTGRKTSRPCPPNTAHGPPGGLGKKRKKSASLFLWTPHLSMNILVSLWKCRPDSIPIISSKSDTCAVPTTAAASTMFSTSSPCRIFTTCSRQETTTTLKLIGRMQNNGSKN